MSGFPARPARSAFGPTKQNERSVQNPQRELAASEMNLAFFQNAGMGLVVPRVALVVGVSGAAIVSPHEYQGLAWDPYQQLSDIAVAYNGTGDYTATFAATYPDQLGNSVATSLKAGLAAPRGSTNVRATVDIPTTVTARVYVFDADAGTPVDSDFLLLLW